MPKPRDPLAAKLVAASLDFHRLKLWLELDRNTAFLIRLPDEPHPFVASVIGQYGEQFGLSLYRGAGAIDCLRQLMLSDGEGPMAVGEDGSLLSVTFGPLGEIPLERREILNAAGFAARREVLAPCFFTLLSTARVRSPNRTEMRLLLSVLRAIGVARAEGPLESGRIELDEEMLQLRVIEQDGKPSQVVREFAKLPPPSIEFLARADLRSSARAAPQSTHRWVAAIVDASLVPHASMEDDDRAFVVVNEETGSIACATLALPHEVGLIATELFLRFTDEAEETEPGRPAEIVLLDSELARRLEAVLADVGVRVSHAESSPRFHEILQSRSKEVARAVLESIGDAPPDPAHEPTTLKEWKALDEELFEFMEDYALADEEGIADSIRDFFGDVEAGWQEIDSAPEALPAFVEWYASYELDETERTLLERWLACAQSPALRTLLEARQRATVSVYRIAERDAAAGVTRVVDVFSGASRSIVDSMLAGSTAVDAIVALRVYETPVGLFAAPASRPFSTFEFDAALAFLGSIEGPITAESLTESPDLLGLTFKWYRDWRNNSRSRPLQLANIDGESFSPQTATYSIADRDAVIEFLEGHAAFERENTSKADRDGDTTFIWLKATSKGKSAFGGETVFGRFVVGAATMRVEVNSDHRAEMARKMLERIAGVRFLRDEKLDLARAMADAANAKPAQVDRPDPNDPEVFALLKNFLDQRHMRWLDESIPMFGGLTPREMARTPEGKARVALFIRTMPAAMTACGPSIEPPRAEMLRALGVEDPLDESAPTA